MTAGTIWGVALLFAGWIAWSSGWAQQGLRCARRHFVWSGLAALAVAAGGLAWIEWPQITKAKAIASDESINAFGAIGDFFGGILNPLIAGAALIALLYSVKIQREELRLTRRELSRSARALKAQSALTESREREDRLDAALRDLDAATQVVRFTDQSEVSRTGEAALSHFMEVVRGDDVTAWSSALSGGAPEVRRLQLLEIDQAHLTELSRLDAGRFARAFKQA